MIYIKKSLVQIYRPFSKQYKSIIALFASKPKQVLSWFAKLFKKKKKTLNVTFAILIAWRVALLETKIGRISFSISKWKADIALRAFQKVFSKRTFRNIVTLQWEHIRKKGTPSDGNFWTFLLYPIKVPVSAMVIDSLMDHITCCAY